MGFTPHKVEQPLQGIELQQTDEGKKLIGKLISDCKDNLFSRDRSIMSHISNSDAEAALTFY